MSAVVDLHLHTTCSDGKLTPTELIRFVVNRGIKIAAITDHDTTDGIREAIEESENYPELTLVTGVEISANVDEEEVHILGYFIDPTSPALQRTLRDAQNGRVNRGREIINKLGRLGIIIDWARVEAIANGGTITRPHIAQAMIEKGYITSIQEAFDNYIGEGGPADVERERFTHVEAINLIKNSGGVSALAHPARYVKNLEAKLPSLVSAGLVGLETYYKDYTEQEIGYLLELANSYKLVPTGGTDYHAFGSGDEIEPGLVGPPLENFHRLSAIRRLVN